MTAVEQARERLTLRFAKQIRTALLTSLNPTAVAQQWLDSGVQPTTPQDARQWATANIHANSRPLTDILPRLYAESWLLGQRAARAEIGYAAGVRKDSVSDLLDAMATDWDTWQPGNAAASLLLNPSGGLAQLLADAGITIRGIDTVTVERLGEVLYTGVRDGSNIQTISRGITAILGDPQRAVMIARTETARATSIAARELYNDLGVEQVEWLVADPCDLCADNADASPIPIGDTFPSGDNEPPAHPNCMCSIAPYIVDLRGVELEDDEKTATTNKGVPTPLDVERAIARLSILPNPIPNPELEDYDQTVQSPWRVAPVPTINPRVWDTATVAVVKLSTLDGTDPWLWRKKVKKHIERLGQATTPNRSLALIYESDHGRIIVDGHHRLMAWWLLGQDEAPVWIAKEPE